MGRKNLLNCQSFQHIINQNMETHINPLPLIFFFLLLPFTSTQTLEIGIGIGIGPPNSPEPEPEPKPICPPPPPRPLAPSDFPNILQYQSYKVIQRFKKTILNDPNNITQSWSGPNLSLYKGFFLASPPRFSNFTPTIASIDFNNFHLAAPSLSGFLDSFPDLALFHANSNHLTGPLPDLTNLPFLYELDLSNNDFSGQFPSSLPKLKFLDLRFNRFAGLVPPSIFSTNLNYLFLNNNLFSHPLPSDLGRTLANYLTLANNNFTGPIPPSISEANETLIEVLFLGNNLSGCLPKEIGMLKKARVFDAGFNRITGFLPTDLGCLRNVEQLNFAGNLLYGEIPDEVCRLGIQGGGRLLNLSLSDNYFTSLGEICLVLLREGVLNVKKNCIVGCEEQRTVEECDRFLGKRSYCPSFHYGKCY